MIFFLSSTKEIKAIGKYLFSLFSAVYLPAFKVPEVAPAVDEAVPEARNVQPVREENEQPVAAIFPN